MDTVKFIEERRRMCKSFDGECMECPAFCAHGEELRCVFSQESTADATAQIAIVEDWSATHPRKTRQSVFLEQWPGSEIDESGCLMLCPLTVSAERRNRHGECTTLVCSSCRRKFWMQEVE